MRNRKKVIFLCAGSLLLALICVFAILGKSGTDNQYGLTFSLNMDGAGYIVTGGSIPEDGHLVIPDTYKGLPVTEIGFQAFKDSSLTAVTIPDSVTILGGSAFHGCTGLTDVAIPDSVTTIGFHTFYGCAGLTEIIIPDSVTSIGGSAFSDCTGLTKATIGNGVTTIGTKAFFCCTALQSVTMGERVRNIGSYAFHKCTQLRAISIPKDIEVIQKYAFRKCESLTTVFCGGVWKDWYLIRVEAGNEFLTGAAVVYGFTGTELPALCDHSLGQWTQMDATLHKRSCTICGAEATAAHAWENGSCMDCGIPQIKEE